MIPPAPPLPPPPKPYHKERSSSRSRVTKFHPGPAASPSTAIISQATEAITRCLRQSEIHWAVVGGACCVLLGSTRTTDDVDIVVSKPEYVKQLKNLLKTDYRFEVESKTRHTYFHCPGHDRLKIEILCFPSTFQIAFDSGTEVLDVNGVHLLTLTAILNSKCGSVVQRSSESKRGTDLQDIIFILRLSIARGIRFDPNEVPKAVEELQDALERRREGVKQLFQAVGLGKEIATATSMAFS